MREMEEKQTWFMWEFNNSSIVLTKKKKCAVISTIITFLKQIFSDKI